MFSPYGNHKNTWTDYFSCFTYTDLKDPPLEQKLERLLTEHEMFFHKSEVWIEEEKMYEVLYEVVLDLQHEEDDESEDGSEEPESEENP